MARGYAGAEPPGGVTPQLCARMHRANLSAASAPPAVVLALLDDPHAATKRPQAEDERKPLLRTSVPPGG